MTVYFYLRSHLQAAFSLFAACLFNNDYTVDDRQVEPENIKWPIFVSNYLADEFRYPTYFLLLVKKLENHNGAPQTPRCQVRR